MVMQDDLHVRIGTERNFIIKPCYCDWRNVAVLMDLNVWMVGAGV